MRTLTSTGLCIALAALMAACSADPPPAQGDSAPNEPATAAPPAVPATPAPDAAPAPSAPAPVAAAPAFAGKVWRVVESGGVAAGTRYAFLPDGALVITAPDGSPPGYGKWTWANGKLTIEEEGIAYPTDVVRVDAERLELRSHNPGGTLDIKLAFDAAAELPGGQ